MPISASNWVWDADNQYYYVCLDYKYSKPLRAFMIYDSPETTVDDLINFCGSGNSVNNIMNYDLGGSKVSGLYTVSGTRNGKNINLKGSGPSSWRRCMV